MAEAFGLSATAVNLASGQVAQTALEGAWRVESFEAKGFPEQATVAWYNPSAANPDLKLKRGSLSYEHRYGIQYTKYTTPLPKFLKKKVKRIQAYFTVSFTTFNYVPDLSATDKGSGKELEVEDKDAQQPDAELRWGIADVRVALMSGRDRNPFNKYNENGGIRFSYELVRQDGAPYVKIHYTVQHGAKQIKGVPLLVNHAHEGSFTIDPTGGFSLNPSDDYDTHFRTFTITHQEPPLIPVDYVRARDQAATFAHGKGYYAKRFGDDAGSPSTKPRSIVLTPPDSKFKIKAFANVGMAEVIEVDDGTGHPKYAYVEPVGQRRALLLDYDRYSLDGKKKVNARLRVEFTTCEYRVRKDKDDKGLGDLLMWKAKPFHGFFGVSMSLVEADVDPYRGEETGGAEVHSTKNRFNEDAALEFTPEYLAAGPDGGPAIELQWTADLGGSFLRSKEHSGDKGRIFLTRGPSGEAILVPDSGSRKYFNTPS